MNIELKKFKDAVSELSYEKRGLEIARDNHLRIAHNSCANIVPESNESYKSDAFHYTAFISKMGDIYEFDGLKPSPIKLQSANHHKWYKTVLAEIQNRIKM